MSTKRFRLTKASKILIMVLVIALIGGGVFAGVKTGLSFKSNPFRCKAYLSWRYGTVRVNWMWQHCV